MVVAPDAGRVKVAERFSQHLSSDLAVVHKRRQSGTADEVEALQVVGDVSGRRCVLIDDMIDTAGTIVAAADLLVERGAAEVWCMATHAVLSDPAVDRLKNSALTKVVVTNTLPIPTEHQFDKLEVLSVAKLDLRRHRRGVRGHLGLGDLRRREPGLIRFASPDGPAGFRPLRPGRWTDIKSPDRPRVVKKSTRGHSRWEGCHQE